MQEQADQLQTGDNAETSVMSLYEQTLSLSSVVTLSGMGRSHASDLNSNASSTPSTGERGGQRVPA